MFVDDFAREFQRYCEGALAQTLKAHGKPTELTVGWNPMYVLWGRVNNLGWSACVGGEWHEQQTASIRPSGARGTP